MNDDRLQMTFLALALILPVGALAARRMPLGDTAKMALCWVAIFALLFVLVALWQGATSAGATFGGLFQ